MVCHVSLGKLKAGVQKAAEPVGPSVDSGSEVKQPRRRRKRGNKAKGSPTKVSKTSQAFGEYCKKYFEEMRVRESATGSRNQPDRDVPSTAPGELGTG